MTTHTIKLHAENDYHIEKAIELLKNEKIVALPTETVYGLAGNGFSSNAIRNIFLAKNRPMDNPLIHHIGHFKQALDLYNVDKFNAKTKHRLHMLAEQFWPGPLTIIAKRSEIVLDEACASLVKVGVRIPNNKHLLKILNSIEFPLVMPSANSSSRPSPTSAKHVLTTLEGKIDGILDGGKCNIGLESTVVEIDETYPRVLREGMISIDDLRDCLNEPVKTYVNNNLRPLAPGQKYLHYSPKLSSINIVSDKTIKNDWLGKNTFLCQSDDAKKLEKNFGTNGGKLIAMKNNPNGFAQDLYDKLYQAEFLNMPLKILLPQDASPKWHGIIDRLKRSAGLQ